MVGLVVPAELCFPLQPAQQHRLAVEHRGEVDEQRGQALELDSTGGKPAEQLADAGLERLRLGQPAERGGRAVAQRLPDLDQVRADRCGISSARDRTSERSWRASSIVKMWSTPDSLPHARASHQFRHPWPRMQQAVVESRTAASTRYGQRRRPDRGGVLPGQLRVAGTRGHRRHAGAASPEFPRKRARGLARSIKATQAMQMFRPTGVHSSKAGPASAAQAAGPPHRRGPGGGGSAGQAERIASGRAGRAEESRHEAAVYDRRARPPRCCGHRRIAAGARAGRGAGTDLRLRGQPDRLEDPAGATPRHIDGFQIPHQDGAGVIDAVGEGVDPGRAGQRGWLWMAASGRRWGTAAERPWCPRSGPSGYPTEYRWNSAPAWASPRCRAPLPVRRRAADARRCLSPGGRRGRPLRDRAGQMGRGRW